ncbi:MAG: hypothetical protein ASARMPRED_001089 [Alectoria sarmentosa]|nr:MAG: hypothetical protein ASARMPRED_001089 [Alectoria sarmentosa]
MTPGDNTGVGVGPGPLRHPRPLTAADLHMQLEKEQEAVVNRLTRELSLLRQQSASVASTTSSVSTGLPDATDQNANHLISGASHPTPSRRHRSSSNLSTRSANTAATTATGITGTSGSTIGTTAGVAGSTVSGIAPARDTTAPYSYARDPLSRQSSVTSRRSEASSPSLSSSMYQGDHFPNLYAHRHSGSASYNQPSSSSQQAMNAGNTRVPSTQRYEEVAHHRSELDIVKRENEALRRRIQELERSLSSRRQSGTGITRSVSVSTNASIPPTTGTGGRGRGTEEDEDAVHVGESAGSVGFGGGH